MKEEVSDFISAKDVKIFSTHDGAANMLKASRLLRTEVTTHCVAHALHLLLITDGVNKVPDILSVLEKCKNITNALHFKGHLIQDELLNIKDESFVNYFMEKIQNASEIIHMDTDMSIGQVSYFLIAFP